MKFRPDRLIQLRTSMNISKPEAARQLNISAMTYGRYEKGEREPSYPSVSYIAQIFHCNIDFLYGTSDVMNCDYIVISRSESPELYSLVETLQQNHDIKDGSCLCTRTEPQRKKGIKKQFVFYINLYYSRLCRVKWLKAT